MALPLRRSFDYVNAWGPGADWTRYIQGPALAIWSWFPNYKRYEAMPGGELKSLWHKDKALRTALGLGNHRPIERLDIGEFTRNLELKDFRAALAIDQPKLYLDVSDRAVGTSFVAMGRVGHTPLRKGKAVVLPEGIGEGACDVYLQPNGCTIECWYRFKIGWAGDLVAWALTGHRAPWAFVKVTYVMEVSGRVTITVFGSHVPSHTVYVDWESKQEREYRLEYDCTADSFRRFVEAGACKDAPISEIYRIQCEGNETTPA